MMFKKLETEAPSAQSTVDIFKDHWASDLSRVLPGVTAGAVPLFDERDNRPKLAATNLGSNGTLVGMHVLELGPLEGGHTYQLEQLGAASVVAIEANAEAFLKCLLIKELLSMRAKFLFGDFLKFLEANTRRYDMVFCSGVLYHMAEPLRLIKLISQITDRCFVWTHYFRDDVKERRAVDAQLDGLRATYWVHDYGTSTELGTFWGGNQPVAAWMYKEDVLGAFRHFGFNDIQICFDSPEQTPGPAFAFTARKS